MKEEIISCTKNDSVKQSKFRFLDKIRKKYGHLLKPFIILFFIYLLAIYPILRINFNYLDDAGRAATGYREWKEFSRFIPEYFSIFIHTSTTLTDISPLPQLIAIAVMSLSSVIILYLFKNDKKITCWDILAIIPLGISPYFLECLSYKFDSPYMAVSILASIAPFLLYNSKSKYNIKYIIAIVIGTIIMCTSYQASSGIIPLMTLFLMFKFWNNKEDKKILKFFFTTVLSFLFGLLVFKVFIMNPVDGYVSNHIFPIKELIPGFFNNLIKYYEFVKSDFRGLWLLLIGILIVFFIFISVKNSNNNKILSFFLSIVLIGISALVVFGLYPAFTKPLYSPRAMYGVGVFIALICINITNNDKLYISKIVVLGLFWCFFTFAFTYGNALGEQKRYIDFRVQSVVNELNQLDIMNSGDMKNIVINGSIGSAPAIDTISKGYHNIITRLITQSFGGEWVWNTYYFLNYFKLKNVQMNGVVEQELEMVKDTMYYTIESNNKDYIVITLKE